MLWWNQILGGLLLLGSIALLVVSFLIANWICKPKDEDDN